LKPSASEIQKALHAAASRTETLVSRAVEDAKVERQQDQDDGVERDPEPDVVGHVSLREGGRAATKRRGRTTR